MLREGLTAKAFYAILLAEERNGTNTTMRLQDWSVVLPGK